MSRKNYIHYTDRYGNSPQTLRWLRTLPRGWYLEDEDGLDSAKAIVLWTLISAAGWALLLWWWLW